MTEEWWKVEMRRIIRQVAAENYEAGQMDVRRKMVAKMNSVLPNETFSREEIERYLSETGGE